MQDTTVNSIGAPTGSESPGGRIATLPTRAKRQLGYAASPMFSSVPFGELVVVSLVSILIIRGSG